MTDPTSRRHAEGAPPASKALEPSYAEQARTLLERGGFSTLATLSAKHPGHPFASVMPYSLTERGEPVFLISSMAMHTKNLDADGRATLMVVDESAVQNPLGASRVSMMGTAVQVPEADVSTVRERYLARNPAASQWVDFSDFHFYRLEVMDLYFVGGFGVMGWIPSAEYAVAAPDPLADAAAEIIRHMNGDHQPAMILLAARQTGWQIEQAAMTAVDRLGFQLRLTTSEGPKGLRIAFPQECDSPDKVRSALVEMVRAARTDQDRG